MSLHDTEDGHCTVCNNVSRAEKYISFFFNNDDINIHLDEIVCFVNERKNLAIYTSPWFSP